MITMACTTCPATVSGSLTEVLAWDKEHDKAHRDENRSKTNAD